MSSRFGAIPGIQRIGGPVAATLRALKERTEVRDGSRGVSGDRFMTYNELIAMFERGDIQKLTAQSAVPTPGDGEASIWLTNGRITGDNGDLLITITVAGVTKTGTLIDFSAL